MNFDDFRKDIETKISTMAQFELQEFHYQPYSFGNGTLAFRIKGQIHKFEYDGRENQLTWFVSNPHQKYIGANFKEILRKNGLGLSLDDLKREIE